MGTSGVDMDFITTTSMVSSLLNTTDLINSTERRSSSSVSPTMYISIFLIWAPGIVTNIFALTFIIRDIRKAVFPALLLLLVLCTADLIAVSFSVVKHTIAKKVTPSFESCAAFSVVHTFFRIYAGVVNALMAIDRVLAICTPFFYKRCIDVTTWKLVCLISAMVVLFFNCFPLLGLGSVMGIRSSGAIYCTALSFKNEPIERVYGFGFGIVGTICVTTVVVCNMILIRSILKMNNRITNLKTSESSSEQNSDGQPNTSVTSFEVAFAKLMGGLATVYLVCGTPYNALILINQFNIKVNPAVTGYIHLLGGFSYTADPIVYILIRKTNRKRILEYICRCKRDVEAIK
ncbi:hypothetical protein ACF0H5_007445 [Mactra antiquata]